ncbi:MAG: hypothetical protein JSW47_00800 [Phycisphaerales bacterium]|nr:MAG: hypothetical protein JSW47_00800 [Phycisphaerales bacterium]
MKRYYCGVAGIWVLYACSCLGAPKPAIVPAPGQWTVNVEFTHPQQIVLTHSLDGRPLRYWYTIITIYNNTGQDVDFYPKCDLMTDSFQITAAGKFVSPLVFEQIRRRHKARYPFIEPLDKAGNKLLEGEDNTKDIAIIWPDFDVQAKNIKIFISGLSNETAVVAHPVSKDAAGEPIRLFLRKTLELSYALRGDASLRSDASLVYKGKRWIMR